MDEEVVSLNLDMILSVGFAAERAEVMDMLRSRGYMPIRETDFLALLEYHCSHPALPIPSSLYAQVVTGVEMPDFLRTKGIEDPFWTPNPLFRHMYQMDNVGAEATDGSVTVVDFQVLLSIMHSVSEAGAVVADALTRKLAKALSITGDDIDPSNPMHVYGVHSIVAVEMRNWLAKEPLADVAVF